MKFRWVPFYSEVLKTDLKRADAVQRIREVIRHDYWLQEISDFLGKKFGSKIKGIFEGILERRLAILRKSEIPVESARWLFLSADVFETENGCEVKLRIAYNKLAALLLIPIALQSIVSILYFKSAVFLSSIVQLYVISILLFNYRAPKLYRHFVKAIEAKAK